MTDSKKPNPEITASDLWTAIKSIGRAHRVVDYPKKDPNTGQPVGKIAIRVLTQEEQFAASKAAEKFAKEHMGPQKKDEESPAYTDVYRNAAAIEVLIRACRDPDNLNVAIFPNHVEVRKHLTNDELGVLMRLYMQVQADLGPIIAYMTDEEREAWIDRLVEGGDAFPLARLSSDEHDRLTLHLASQLRKSRTASSYSGSPQSESTLDSVPLQSSQVIDEFGAEPSENVSDEFSGK